MGGYDDRIDFEFYIKAGPIGIFQSSAAPDHTYKHVLELNIDPKRDPQPPSTYVIYFFSFPGVNSMHVKPNLFRQKWVQILGP